MNNPGIYQSQTIAPKERGAILVEITNRSHGVKRGGNNHFGSTGILKCLTCRKRKGKVVHLVINANESANTSTRTRHAVFVQIVH